MRSMILSIRTQCHHVATARKLIKRNLLGLFLALILSPCCLAQEVIFEDSFDDPTLTNWILVGSPSPVALSEAEGRMGVFDNMGDANYDSGVVSKDTFSLTNGFILETDIFVNNPATYACVDFGFTDSTEPDLLEYGIESQGGSALLRGHFLTENGGHETSVTFRD